MTFYAGDEYADDDCTSGPYDPKPFSDDFPDEGWAEDHDHGYDREQNR